MPTDGVGTPASTLNEPKLPQLEVAGIGVHAPVPVAVTVTERHAGLTEHAMSECSATVAVHVCPVATQVHAHESLLPVGPAYPFIA